MQTFRKIMNTQDQPLDAGRRDFLRRSGKVSVAALGGLSVLRQAQAAPSAGEPRETTGHATGLVFHDANGSGRAHGQEGLAGVLVSNGVDVVATDSRGRYRLPVTDDTIIHVIKPRGYATKVDGLNIPRFYYIHKPSGSPDSEFIYKGVAPTGPLPESIDFPLDTVDERGPFEVLMTADPQPYHLQHVQWYGEETVRAFQGLKAACGIALGDIVGDHLDLYEPYNALNAKSGFPWYNVVGNHDLNFMAREDRYSTETFQRVFGPTTYAFQRGPVHFIIINNVYWEGFTRMRADGWPRRGQYFGHIRPEQFQYLRNYLRHVPTDERVVLCSHIPLINRADTDAKHETAERRELLELLSRHRYTLSFSGHTHINMNYFLGSEEGYTAPGGALHHHCNLTATCGSWYRGPLDLDGLPYSPGRDGSPKGYAIVRFEGAESYTIRLHNLGGVGERQFSIQLPSLVLRPQLGETPIRVNVFSGSVKTRVRARIDEGDWFYLDQVESTDAAYELLRARAAAHPEAGEGELPAPMITDHQWVHALPGDLSAGWHRLQVEVRGTFGERWSDERTFVVASDATELEHLNAGTRTVREI